MREADRRQHRRYEVDLDVVVQGLGGALRLSTRDVSVGGVFLFCVEPLPIDQQVRLAFSAGAQALTATATVVHHLPGVGFGLRFDHIAPDATEALMRFLATAEIDEEEEEGERV